jgi:predicted  nucleic acid-binding Zn-ribbon protein
MTRDDIIRLAREAGFIDWSLHGRLESKEEALERFAALVAAAEREALESENKTLKDEIKELENELFELRMNNPY